MKNGLIYLFFFICSIAESQNQFYYSFYDKHWEFREVGTRKYYPAKVPGTVHLDLMSNGLIPNPYFESKEKSVQWVEEKDWEYVCEFRYGGKSDQHTELIFEGLDTYARVYLNGRLILKSKNMFTRYTIDVKKYLKNGNNKLKVVFESAVKHGKAEAKKLPYTLPGDEKVFTRKAQYQYGWDWGPRLVTAGIYKHPYLLAWNELKINSCYHHVKSITDTLAEVYLIWETESDTSRKYSSLKLR